MGAARLILRDGYFDNEIPIVVVESSQFIVLEGNRRVSALKVLRDPSIVPQFEADVRALLNRYAIESENLPEAIRVFVAPDRTTAAPHIARLHTGVPKRRWSRDQQATFYYSLLDSSTTVDDIKAAYPDVDVVRFMKMAVMRRMLAAVPFKKRALRAYAASDRLRMSVFEYAYRNKDVAAAIGVKFDGDGFLEPRSLPPEKLGKRLSPAHTRVLEYLLAEFEAENLNTRSPEFQRKSEKHRDFLVLLEQIAASSAAKEDPGRARPSGASSSESADSGRWSGGTTNDGGTDANERADSERPTDEEASPKGSPGSGSGQSEGAGPTPRGPNHPQTKDKLDLAGVDYESVPVNLKLRYLELRKISISELPISAAILLRSVLEATIKIHFEPTPTPARGQLSDVFKLVEASYGRDKSLQASIQHLKSAGGNRAGSIQWFNLVAHSADAAVTADEVREAWSRLNPLIRRLLRPA